jgi:predicted acylesterase/phospholipase RssA
MYLRLSKVMVYLLLLAPAAVSAAPAAEGCPDSNLPYAINFGLPRLADSPALQPDSLTKEIGKLFQDFYADHGRCPARQLQVNITVANEYQILDWLGRDMLDAAVVPDLTVYLLQRDGIPVQEMEVAHHPVGDLLLPAFPAHPLSGRWVGRGWHAGSNPRADFAAFLEQTWQQAHHPARDGQEDGPPPAYRIVLASHLSSPGFLDPLAQSAQWMRLRLKDVRSRQERKALRKHFWQAFFDNTRFAVDCDSIDPGAGWRSCWRPPEDERILGSGPTEILFPGECTLRTLPAAASPQDGATVYREHLILSNRLARELFRSGFAEPHILPPKPLRSLFVGPNRPAPLVAILDPEPSFGTRTFGFTVDESLRLLRQNQSTSERKERHQNPGDGGLALVLPGGGVKAAYQSGIVGELYRRRYVQNFRTDTTQGSRRPLEVNYVIGTSGGALLGFFVAQLRERGPWELSRILWQKEGNRFLDSTDVFGWTDLLRYVSVVASFLVLCALLALVSVPEQARLNPPPKPPGAGGRRRILILGVLLPVLFCAPLLVRWVSGEGLQEQVPEFGGLIYAVLAMIAMVADQSMIHDPETRRDSRVWMPPWLPIAAGCLLIALPLLCLARDRPFAALRQELTFGPAFGVLAPLVLFGGLVFPLRSGRVAQGPRGWLRLALDGLVPAGLALAAACYVPKEWQDTAGKIPFFLTGLLLILLCVGANYFLGAAQGRLRRWRLFYYGTLALATLLLLILSWAQGAGASDPQETFGTKTLGITLGTFLVCIGLIILLLGAVAGVYAVQRDYHLRLRELLIGFFVILLHAVSVYLILFVVIKLLPDWLSPLELTGAFWMWLLATSLVLGTVLVLAGLGRRGRPLGKMAGYLRRSLEFLCSHHPNGNVVTRRFLRLALLAVSALAWWNLVLAPALYGNRSAQLYLAGAVDRFEKKTGQTQNEEHRFRPTAHFIAPANVLARDGTRYFLFSPEGVECRKIPRRSGAEWRRYKEGAPEGECKSLPSQEFLEDVIFASGSPFPIFPAHGLEDGKRKEFLVDGGYSNNVPVDVALNVSAEQVLIVDSTHPVESPARSTFLSRLGMRMTGELIRNLSRLPGYLFERSQELDRLSRRDLFVISLAPSRDEIDWPPLFDFRQSTVERMERVARRDLRRRIGLIESWGRPPSIQLSVLVEGKYGPPAR